ncbi:uncharacterized protein [Pagrus major]|uniref:uncharacterized protein n=1 Tax=Pagrus major TaxID=143350 RepID=UPI003CC89E99
MGSLLELLCLFSVVLNISGVIVILGDSFKFPMTAGCQKQRAELRHRLDSSRTDLVARREDDWIPGPGYEDRIDPNASVVLKSTNYNDNGLYESTCEETPTQLDVVRASAVSVRTGGAVSFSFFYVTAGAHGTFKLVRDRETVCEVDLSSGMITYGTGSEERLSLRSDWRSHGELTPTLQQVKPEDQGDYFAYVEEKDGKKKSLSAWRIKVPDPDQSPATPGTTGEMDTRTHLVPTTLQPPLNGTTGERMDTWIIVIVSVVITAAVTSVPWALCFFLVRRPQMKFKQDVSPGPDGGRPPTDVEMRLLTNGNSAGPQTNGGPRVQNLTQ